MRLIDADALLERNKEFADCEFNHPKFQETLREIVDTEPTVEQKQGKWIQAELDKDFVVCSVCKNEGNKHCRAYRPDYASWLNYCPNCGARMVGEQK